MPLMSKTYRVEAHCQKDRGINAVNISEYSKISEDMENAILEKFGKTPEADEDGSVYQYTEEDIWEQIRKMLQNK